MRTDRYLFAITATPELLVEVLVELDDVDAQPAVAEVVLVDEVRADLGPGLIMSAELDWHRPIVATASRALRRYDEALSLSPLAGGVLVYVVPQVDPEDLYADDPPLAELHSADA